MSASRRLLARLLPAGAAAAALVLALSLVASRRVAADGERDEAIHRGPFVSIGTRGTPVVEVLVADETARALTVRASWEADGAKVEKTYPFETVAGTRRRSTLEGVPPGMRVDYEVRSGNETLAKGLTLDALPAPDATKLRFCVLGDTGWPRRGTGHATEEQLHVAALLEAQRPALALHVGDLIYLAGQDSGLDPLVFKPYAATMSRAPFFLALGNHDLVTREGAPELEAMPFPPNQGGNRWYSFDTGGVHFAALDSNAILEHPEESAFAASAQGKWLKADLASARTTWKVVWFHHPLYTSTEARGFEVGRMRSVLEPTLAAGGVDVCFVGHDHFYSRSPRVLGGKADGGGIVHVVTGGGGARLYDGEPAADGTTAAFARSFHLVRVDVDGSAMTVSALAPGKGGATETLDTVTLAPRKPR